jgi:hypothetical protein
MIKKIKNFPAPPCFGEVLKRGTLLKMNKLTLFVIFLLLTMFYESIAAC